MWNFLKRVFIGCEHKWIERAEYRVNVNSNGIPEMSLVVLRCEKCGTLKNHKISV